MSTQIGYDVRCMGFTDFESRTCSVSRTLEVLGDRWTVLVLRDLFNGVHRFDDLQGHLGIARDVLTRRLSALVEQGVVQRVAYREPRARGRFEYHLTARGRELRPVLLAMIAWGDRHRDDGSGPPLVVSHDGCGAPVGLAVECSAGHRIEPMDRLHVEPGPGARRRVADG